MPSLVTNSASTNGLMHLVQRRAAERPGAAALLGGTRGPLTYAGLAGLVESVGKKLRSVGVGAADRVAMVLPNGPEAATCFLGVASYATAAPLNPSYKRSEVEFYLEDLRAKILIVQAGVDSSAAREAAAAVGAAVVELEPSAEVAGLFALVGGAGRARARRDTVDDADASCDVALVLHTSGTTARPKIVPLSRENLCTSAGNIASSLGLTAADRCLNVMPLFHIHGLVGALLSTLHAGGSVACEGAFDAARSLDAIETLRPTWYTAVPTMHQAIVAAAGRRGRPVSHSLRFIRSCSSALAPTLMAKVEETFGVPVVEAYGMTEAAHQMACNPLPPRQRKPGSVGVATGVGVAIMDAAGSLLPAGAVGEVVIRGANVTAGYEDNPQANFDSFTDGWFRTGDQGRMDDEGYLFLTGRIKELINRGGEKLSPREIDEALLTHPGVAQAMAFALPHATLGEDIAAAVVAKDGVALDASEVRRHAAGVLAEFKVPQRVVVVAEIPKGPTGKPQRIGLAEKLGLVGAAATLPTTTTATEQPLSDTEQRLAKLWGQVLEAKEFGRGDRFFARGGDSLSGTMLVELVAREFNVALPVRALFESETLADLATVIDGLPRATGIAARRFASLVPFQTVGNRTPFFMVHGHSGRAAGLSLIAPYLPVDQPFYGFEARGMDGRRMPHWSFAAMAADYLVEVREVQPRGPYLLGGFCAGGMVAYEMAQQLMAEGEQVERLILLDTAHPRWFKHPPRWLQAARTMKLVLRRLRMRAVLATGRTAKVKLGERIVNETQRRRATFYQAAPYAGRVTLVRSAVHHRTDDPMMGWDGMAAGGVDFRPIEGDHAWLLTRKGIGPAGRAIAAALDEAWNQPEAWDERGDALAAA